MRADVTYSYCGYNSAGSYCPASSLQSDFVEASFTVKNALPANVTEAITPENFEMGTSYYIYPTSLSVFFPPGVEFQPTLTLDVSTDSKGNIVDWYMLAAGGDQQQYGSALLETCSHPAPFHVSCRAGNGANALDYFQFVDLHGLRVGVNVANDPGMWTAAVDTPEPSGAILLAAGGLGLAAFARKKRGRS